MKPYIPDILPLANIDWAKHVTAIGNAQIALGRYDGMLKSIVNPTLLLSPLISQEAVLSSQIEGTQASLADVLGFDADPVGEPEDPKNDDIKEVINYRSAIAYATKKLETHPISLNVIKELHAILLNSVRGRSKSPGEFRTIQNYIGSPGAKMEEATFIPPGPEIIMPCLDNWEKYVHFNEKDYIVQLAIVKAQFEIIHPFLDGNGRIGRLLIPLFLYAKGILSSPMFYLSSYFETNRQEYYDKLQAVSEKKDWDGWISFFLQAIIEQAEINISKTGEILSLYEKMKIQIPELTSSQFAISAVDALFGAPLLTTKSFIRKSEIHQSSAKRIVNILRDNNIIIEIREAKGRTPALYVFKELFEIVG